MSDKKNLVLITGQIRKPKEFRESKILDKFGNAALVYLQPGDMVLYEGAYFKHGRPMRFKGNMFANIFTHFAPFER